MASLLLERQLDRQLAAYCLSERELEEVVGLKLFRDRLDFTGSTRYCDVVGSAVPIGRIPLLFYKQSEPVLPRYAMTNPSKYVIKVFRGERTRRGIVEMGALASMTSAAVSQIEHGRRSPRIKSLEAIAGALGLEPRYFVRPYAMDARQSA